MQDSKRDTDVKNRLLDSVGEGKGGMIWENSIEPVTERKGPQYYEQVPVYVCPGGRKDQNQIEKCGGVDSFYCAAWGCETTGTVHWLTNSNKDLINPWAPWLKYKPLSYKIREV